MRKRTSTLLLIVLVALIICDRAGWVEHVIAQTPLTVTPSFAGTEITSMNTLDHHSQTFHQRRMPTTTLYRAVACL